MPKVSVIIPVYKVEKYIERCSRSLFGQTLDDIEYIFIDDCSSDNSISILKSVLEEYPSRRSQVHILVHEKSKGPSSARNTGLMVATGEYVTYCDSDDWVDLTMYEKLYNHAICENADVCFSNFQFVYSDGCQSYETTTVYVDKSETINSYIGTCWNVLWNMIAKKQLYIEHSLKSPEDITFCEDFWLSVRLFYHANKIAKVEDTLYFYNRMNVNSIINRTNKKYETDERWVYLDTICFFKEKGVYSKYEKTMCWRILKNIQDSAMYIDKYKDFLFIYPESHKYIWNCPYIKNIKSRIIMSLLAFYPLRFVGVFLVWLRNLRQNRTS